MEQFFGSTASCAANRSFSCLRVAIPLRIEQFFWLHC